VTGRNGPVEFLLRRGILEIIVKLPCVKIDLVILEGVIISNRFFDSDMARQKLCFHLLKDINF
jgi:hypothetical protein